ncbi:hypothetical protein [Pedobacter terrae]|uniref:hypothetical protein n=1 Tax=Pedobacter terrae TaxID=405671 RepID=UPI00115FEAB7|nr:hypothetical protein [Pedobacter terrae]
MALLLKLELYSCQKQATLSDFIGVRELVTPPRQADASPMSFLLTLKEFAAKQVGEKKLMNGRKNGVD